MARILVTGSNRGIGLELCRLLSGRGDTVVAVCRTTSKELDALAGVDIEAGVDVTNEAAVAALCDRHAGSVLDGLILNAGILRRDLLGGLDFEQIRSQMEVNAFAPLRLASSLLGHLSDGARVAFITSRLGSLADNTAGGMYGYRMSKAALNMAGRSLAIDVRHRDISVGLLHPGYVRTEMTGGGGDVDTAEAAAGLIARYDALGGSNTGQFWHATGAELPW